MTDISSEDLLIYTTEIVTALLSNSEIETSDLPELISTVSAVVGSLGDEPAVSAAPREPAVPIAQSIRPDHLVCLEDGKKMKLLKRYLRANYDLSPEEYRARWNLPADYPMVAPDYAATRKALAVKSGLGRKSGTPDQVSEMPKPDKRATRKASETPAAEAAPPPAPTPVPTPEPAPVRAEAPAPAPAEPARPATEATAAARPRAKLKPVFRAAEPDAAPAAPKVEQPAAVAAPAPVAPTTRRTLSARLAPVTPPIPAGEDVREGAEHRDALSQAIASRTCVRAVYNKKEVILAPYIVYTRNDELFMRAVTMEHDGRRPRELKLGTFKLMGLSDVSGTTRRFVQQFDFNPRDAQYAGKTLDALK